MTTCTYVDEPEGTPPKSPWVRGILLLGHLAIIVGLRALPFSPRPEPQKLAPSGPHILDCLRSSDGPSSR
jgi:hypothetical protein